MSIYPAVGTVLYECRLGALQQGGTGREPEYPHMQRFIEATNKMVACMGKLVFLPRNTARWIYPKYQKMMDESWEELFKFGRRAEVQIA